MTGAVPVAGGPVNATVLAALVGAAVAVVGFLVKYLNDLAIARRKDRLDRVNQQLRLLYGPLYAADQATRTAWDAFRTKWRQGKSYWKSDPPPTEAEAAAWRLWMGCVFMPANLRMEALITENADLIIEPEMPPPLLHLCAHVAAYKPVVEQWARGDYTSHVSIVNYPSTALRDYVSESFRALKSQQAELIAALGRAPRRAPGKARGPAKG